MTNNYGLKFQANLAELFSYKKLTPQLSKEVREGYERELPKWLDPWHNLYTLDGTLIAIGYDRVVIGDYGAFIEINKDQLVKLNVVVAEGQEYRYEAKYDKCKYYWLTATDNSDIKIYHQRLTVDYADYKKDKYYVSPYEVKEKK